jgi:hypothetical protein
MVSSEEAPQAFGGAALEIIEKYLVDEGWPCERIDEQTLLRTRFQGHHGEWFCFAHARPQFDQVVFYSIAPMTAPEVLRPAVAEYLTRANLGLIIGNFELDYGDGEVRFKTSIQLNGSPLTPPLLQGLVYANVAAMDKYLPGLQAVISLTQTPSAAISAIEGE